MHETRSVGAGEPHPTECPHHECVRRSMVGVIDLRGGKRIGDALLGATGQ